MFGGGSGGWGSVRRVGWADRGRMLTVVCVCVEVMVECGVWSMLYVCVGVCACMCDVCMCV